MQSDDQKIEKLDYEPPRLRVIELVAEEVLSVGCKTAFADPMGIAGNGCLSGFCSTRLGS